MYKVKRFSVPLFFKYDDQQNLLRRRRRPSLIERASFTDPFHFVQLLNGSPHDILEVFNRWTRFSMTGKGSFGIFFKIRNPGNRTS